MAVLSYNVIEELVVPEGVTTIKKNAFLRSGITTITLPVSITCIEDYAFHKTNLTTVYYAGTMEQWKAVPKDLKSGNHYTVICSDGSLVEKPELAYALNEAGTGYNVVGIGTYLEEELNIPAQYNGLKVTGIGAAAFKGSDFKKVTLPDTIVELGAEAFAHSYVDTIYYDGTKAEWEKISKKDGWNNSYAQTSIVCTDGTIEGNKNIIGYTDCSSGFWTVFSDTVKVEKGTTETITFRNYTKEQYNWNTFHVVLQNLPDIHTAEDNESYCEWAVLRADNFGWGTGYTSAKIECDWNWDTFLADMNGALVELKVTNHGTTADVIATVTTKNGKVYTQKYLGVTVDGDLYYCLTLDQCYLEILE